MFIFALILSLSGAALADGACCDDGYCTEEAEDVCNGGGGSFYGDGSTCGDAFVDCSGTAPGACCIGDTCEFKKRKLTQKEMEQVEAEWIENNSHFTKPDKDSQKTLIDCIKLMHNIWGFSTSTQTIFDQRKQTIHIEGESDESI